MGDDFFSNLDSTFLCFEQYRRYFCLDFVDFWVCCSWDKFARDLCRLSTLSWRFIVKNSIIGDMSIIIYNNPESDTLYTFNHGHLEGIFSIASLSLLSLALLLLLSCSAPHPFLGLSLHLSALFSFTLSLSSLYLLALRPSYSLGLSPSALQLKLDIMDRS